MMNIELKNISTHMKLLLILLIRLLKRGILSIFPKPRLLALLALTLLTVYSGSALRYATPLDLGVRTAYFNP